MALSHRLRPTAALFRDPQFGHRNTFTGEPDGDANDWTPWDYAIATAMQAIEDGTTEEGVLIWELADDNVWVDPVKKWNKVRQAQETITNREGYKSTPGEYFVPELRQHGVEPGKERWQTRAEWIQKSMAERLRVD